jgi:Peptidase_C39 like family
MSDGLIRLRARRRTRAPHRGPNWRIPMGLTTIGLLLGAACLAPMAPTALAPMLAADQVTSVPAPPVLAVAAQPLQPVAAVPVVPTATPVPTLRPTATPAIVVPTLGAGGRALLDSVRADRTAQWMKNHAETPLRSGPSEDSVVFTQVPQWSTLRQIESRPGWLLVYYSGDGETREPGPGWVKASDVGGIDPPTIWLRSARATSLWSAADSAGSRRLELPASALMEVLSGPDATAGPRVHVRLPGDGRQVPPGQGWVDADALARASTPAPSELPRTYPDNLLADVRINVPYRTQLDGSSYAGANCGPTVLGMAMETFGVDAPPPDLRQEVLRSEDLSERDDEAGSFIWALANVAQARGLRAQGLYESDGTTLHQWSVDEIRSEVRAGRPVIVQVYYRGLPGREDSDYWGDHFIVVTGLLGDNLLYNDPIGGPAAREAPGYDRSITPDQLRRAMRASDRAYAFTAFSLSRT